MNYTKYETERRNIYLWLMEMRETGGHAERFR